jgi:hypothetical protein
MQDSKMRRQRCKQKRAARIQKRHRPCDLGLPFDDFDRSFNSGRYMDGYSTVLRHLALTMSNDAFERR